MRNVRCKCVNAGFFFCGQFKQFRAAAGPRAGVLGSRLLLVGSVVRARLRRCQGGLSCLASDRIRGQEAGRT